MSAPQKSSYGATYYGTVAGFCTQPCTGDAECSSAGMVCANVECVDNETTDCGFICVKPCNAENKCQSGVCRIFAGPNNTSVNTRDIRSLDGQGCVTASDCVSGRCTSGVCVPAAGAPNGTACQRSADCASATCINGICRGRAMVGDTCSLSYDCSVGNCCPATSTCGTSC
jgi:hypothetical protein